MVKLNALAIDGTTITKKNTHIHQQPQKTLNKQIPTLNKK
ncbi:hypothetical protein MBCUT_17240 [Methanobrevibacter cuticularis]|uniref:Uncharacterized protein n=1 Tax=Methanobrevibacter cuticularis TaxID=47311 RepID=A0A166D1B5_9EURY|nr:hypothetical protein MBCUT_17240 [Methanobrevibacter cuticularis]